MLNHTIPRWNRVHQAIGLGHLAAHGGPSRYVAAAILVVAFAVTACTQPVPSNPTPSVETPASSPISLPTAGPVTPSPSTESVPPTALPNVTATVQAEATVIALAVDGTVTARLQAVATVATSSPAETPTTSTTPNAADSLTPTVAVTAVPGCPAQPVRGFGILYTSNSTVSTRLGCAEQAEAGTSSVIQMFDRGVMLEFGNSQQIIVLRTIGNTWSVMPDSYKVGQVLPTPTVAPPSGRLAPLNGFGQLWLQQPDIQTQLGWATAPEQDFPTGATELFAHGRMFWTPNKVDYVLYSDNTWQSFPDTFSG